MAGIDAVFSDGLTLTSVGAVVGFGGHEAARIVAPEPGLSLLWLIGIALGSAARGSARTLNRANP